ncbi:MAG TPA: hypothetical protein VNE58_03265 [Casimicrobiaceae bacterium]|nr:hypothetical protein [Casimicrobiaceae bacterium]
MMQHAAAANAVPLGPAERGAGRISLAAYLLVMVQLALLMLLFRQFQIESAAFLRLSLLAFAGFAVYAWLPLAWRPPFFLMLSLTAIVFVLGVTNGLWIIGLGLILIGICHVPLSFLARGVLLLASGALLVSLRASWIDGPAPDVIWPILGSMFMFRIILYFYDLRHDQTPPTPVRTLSYFFMLPNACFPLFPVVDYKTFRRNYFDDDAYRIYQVGIDWMVRGVIHLILYRFIYLHLTLAPAEVSTPSTLMQYLVANFLLYLRVSGLFHLIIGMLCLFGFRLPETHNRYLLASSFTDFWRRINIYWKDFMQKVFYYPALFSLRKLGTKQAMVLATLYVFLLTWLLHAYQWFWLRGTMLLVWQDILFWAILGLLVVANALYELKHGRKRSLGGTTQTWRTFGTLVAKRFATFWLICLLWSFWTTESIAEWVSLWSAVDGGITLDVLLYPALVLVVIVVGSIEAGSVRNVRSTAQNDRALLRTRVVTVISMVALIGVSIEAVHRELGPELATTIHTLRSNRLSRIDNAKLERGYYESLLSVDRFNSQLWEVYAKKPANWLDVEGSNLKRFTGDFAVVELVPSLVMNSNHGKISINRWGMRDQDYERLPPPNTFRVALLGASSVMGWGVGDGETFESILESRLNRERSNADPRYEILNFAVPGHQPPNQMTVLDKALAFGPNAVFYVAAGREMSRASSSLAAAVHKRIDIPFESLREVVRLAGLERGMDEATLNKRLVPFRAEILSKVYANIVERSRAHRAVPVLIFLPQVREGTWQEETPETLRIAKEAGFTVINLADIYKNHDIATLRLAEWDDHPSRAGHMLVADRLYESLNAQRRMIFGRADRASGP